MEEKRRYKIYKIKNYKELRELTDYFAQLFVHKFEKPGRI
jgi:hypothetical protein